MNVLEFNPGWKTNIAFCLVDNTRTYQSNIRELMKNQADGTLANIYNKGWTVYQWIDEHELLRHASNKGHTWAVVFSTGTEFINGTAFFDTVLDLIKQDFFIAGHILDRKDAYYELHHQCYVVNLDYYKQLNYPSIGQQQLGHDHCQLSPNRSSDNWHDEYTPTEISNGTKLKEYQHKCHGWNILSLAFVNNLPVKVFDESIRNNKIHFYPENPDDFYKQLGWAYHRVNYCQTEFIHAAPTEIIDLKPKKYQQIVTPASGAWFREFVDNGTTVIYYDYNNNSLEYWKEHAPKIEGVEYKFVLCDLLTNSNLVNHLAKDKSTLVNLSNIFNYEGTTFFYSLSYRDYKERLLEQELKQHIPDVEIYFSMRARMFDTIPTWHINS